MKKKQDDATASVIGHSPKKHLRNNLDDLATVVAESDLDLHIARLLALHPELKVRFRGFDSAALDDAAKKILLKDMNRALGVRTLRKRKA